jgi:hypothetical protein
MKNLLALIVSGLLASSVFAGDVEIQSRAFGSGSPGLKVPQKATAELPDGLYFAPQYLPGSPTAATIYPRVIDVKCVRQVTGEAVCEGYNWTPDMGRSEYLLIRPSIKELPAPPVVSKKKKAE